MKKILLIIIGILIIGLMGGFLFAYVSDSIERNKLYNAYDNYCNYYKGICKCELGKCYFIIPEDDSFEYEVKSELLRSIFVTIGEKGEIFESKYTSLSADG